MQNYCIMHSSTKLHVYIFILLASEVICQEPGQDAQRALSGVQVPPLLGSLPQLQAVPGLQQVPSVLVPRRAPVVSSLVAGPGVEPGQESCDVPIIRRPAFSATQIAQLVLGLKDSRISPECSVMPNSFVSCIPDLALVSGCCTYFCQYTIRLVLTPQCLAEFWEYICANATDVIQPVADTFERCLPPNSGIQLSCPPNGTTLAMLRSQGMSKGVGLCVEERQGKAANITTGAEASVLPVNASAALGNDKEYYAWCKLQPVKSWPHPASKPGSYVLNSLLAIVRGVDDNLCARNFLSFLPVCFDDLHYWSGCCSLSCRAALTQVPLSCLISYIQAMCTYTPNITNFFTHLAWRCIGTNVSCSGITGPVNPRIPPEPIPAAKGVLPLVLPASGVCPIRTLPWPDYHTLTIMPRALRLLEGTSLTCASQIASMLPACLDEGSVQEGCCTQACAMALWKISLPCQIQLQARFCKEGETAKYALSLVGRCYGVDHLHYLINSTSAAGMPINASWTGPRCPAQYELKPHE